MGMFDWVKCEVPLPDGWEPKGLTLQTKDFDHGLDIYTITPEGRLKRRFVYEDTDPKEIDIEYHGYFSFYSTEGKTSGKRGKDWFWHEYKAKFTDGQLVVIEVIPDVDVEVSDVKNND